MRLDRIVCLANSYKHDHRCVAGISLETKQWVRLVGRQVPGCLTLKETCYPDGRRPRCWMSSRRNSAKDAAPTAIRKMCTSQTSPGNPCGASTNLAMRTFSPRISTKGQSILQGYGDRVYGRKIAGTPVERSLELIHPENLWWWIREENGKRKNRALFRAGNVVRACYDLAVTDPVWLEKLRSSARRHLSPRPLLRRQSPKTFLTVSLSEPFEGFHYKLVAGVVMPAGIARQQSHLFPPNAGKPPRRAAFCALAGWS